MSSNETDIQPQEQAITPMANPFLSEKSANINEGAVEVESSRAIAQVQAAMLIAKKFPRSMSRAYEQIIETCKRKSFAEGALYAYNRGGLVEGPSIRLAEELARAMTNVETGIKELAQYENETEMMAYAWDIERNTWFTRTFRAKHERKTGNSTKQLTDARDIYENNANLGVRRQRACILAIVPPDLTEAAVRQCKLTITDDAKNSDVPLKTKVNALIKESGKMGITVDHIEKYLGKSMDAILPDDYTNLLLILKSIKDGQGSASDWFAIKTVTQGEQAQNLESKLSKPQNKPMTQEDMDKTIAATELIPASEAQGTLGGDK